MQALTLRPTSLERTELLAMNQDKPDCKSALMTNKFKQTLSLRFENNQNRAQRNSRSALVSEGARRGAPSFKPSEKWSRDAMVPVSLKQKMNFRNRNFPLHSDC
jgi:hypothetical protein